jgi:hypothetical protein
MELSISLTGDGTGCLPGGSLLHWPFGRIPAYWLAQQNFPQYAVLAAHVEGPAVARKYHADEKHTAIS